MRLKVFHILLTIAFLAAVPGLAQESVKYNKNGIVMEHPKDWMINDISDSNTPPSYVGIVASSPKYYMLAFTAYLQSDFKGNLKEFNDRMLEGQEVKVVSSKKTTEKVMGQSSQTIISNFDFKGIPFESKVSQVKVGGKTAFVVKEYPVKEKQEAEKELHSVINSIKLQK